MKRILFWFAATLSVVLVTATPAHAHGEDAQEGFLRTQTVTFYDVRFSGGTPTETGDIAMGTGDELTISGRFRILNSWPNQLAEPKTADLGVVVPGPQFIIKEKWVGGRIAPQAFYVEKGASYDFSIRLVARRQGRWHVHPRVSIEGAGTLLGPGQWVNTHSNGAFTNDVKLANGGVVNLEHYGLGNVGIWALLTLLVGGGWLLYWLAPKPLLERAVWIRRGVAESELVSRTDKRVSLGFVGVTVVLLAGGYLWASSAHGGGLPLQVNRFRAEPVKEANFVTMRTLGGTFDSASDTLALDLELTNTSDAPVKLTEFSTSTVRFDSAPTGTMVVTPGGPLAPGETRQVHVSIAKQFREHRLIEENSAQFRIAGLLFFTNAKGDRSPVELDSRLGPAS